MDFIDHSTWHAIGEWIYYFQTLIAGIAAVGAAGVTIFFIRKQIQQNEKHRRDSIARRNKMIKAGLPIAASELISYATRSIKCMVLLHLDFLAESPVKSPPEPRNCIPDYPARPLSEFQKMIEWADDEEAKTLAEIIAFTQVQHARMGSLYANIHDEDYLLVKSSFYGPIMDALGVYHRAEMVFPYVRSKKFIDEICNPDKAITTLTFIFGIVEVNDGLYEYIRSNWPPKLDLG